MTKTAKVFGPALFALALSFAAQDAFAQDQAPQPCTLTRVASLDMTRDSNGRLTVPVSLAGTDRNFLVSLSGATAVTDAVATEMRFRRYDTMGSHGLHLSAMGLPVSEAVTVPDFKIGSIHTTDFDMFIAGSIFTGRSTPYAGSPTTTGAIGTTFLQNFDVELDFKSNKLNLYMPGYCGGSAVFWAKSYAVVPFDLDPAGNVAFHMQLDGQDVTVLANLDPGSAMMGSTRAEAIFGIKDGSPGLVPVPAGTVTLHRYPFKTLAIGGLAINNPSIFIYPDTPSQQCQGNRHGDFLCFGGSDVRIGLSELRAMHMFFSFKEKKLYVTPTDAHQ